MKMQLVLPTVCVLSILAPAGWAQAGGGNDVPIPEVLPRDEEMRLALSAAPEALRDGAGVYVLERGGFVRARESSNGFTCIVNRDNAWSRKPVCYDDAGSEAILPVTLRFGELLMQAVPVQDVRSQIAAGFADGTYSEPSRAGVAYMLSHEIRNCNATTGA